jgi:glycosyltransferase involved in cell wall biosynthesis
VKPDLIYGVGMFPEGLIASISAKLLHRPLIIMTMGSDVRLPNSFVVNLFWKFILRSVRTVIVKEKESANRLTRYANQVEIVILPNGVDQSRFMLNRRECRKSIGLRRGEKMILYVGRLHPVKNVGALIAAFARVHRHFHDVKLFIVGAGPELSNLIKLAGNKHISGSIIFVGRVSPNDVPRFMVAADVFVLPSISEGSPSVVLEALAAGVPVLASNVGGVPDLVRNGQEGFLFEPGDLGQMTDLLSLVLRSHPLRKKMSKNARDRASHFPLTRTHEKILKISLDAMRTF